MSRAVCLRARGIWRTTSLNGFAIGYRKKSYCTSCNNTPRRVCRVKNRKGYTGKPNIHGERRPIPIHVYRNPRRRRRSINLFAEFRHCARVYIIRLVLVLSPPGIVYHRITDDRPTDRRLRVMKRVLSVGGEGTRGTYAFRFYTIRATGRITTAMVMRTGGKKTHIYSLSFVFLLGE